jgi:2-phosphoglycerate kinase
MAKTTVVNMEGEDQIPFFRGILVQSLIKAGLPYTDAYELSQEVREKLRDVDKIAKHDLFLLVADLVEKRHGEKARTAYENKPMLDTDIIVHSPMRSDRFSVGILTHSLEACAIPTEIARNGALSVHETLLNDEITEIDHSDLRKIIFNSLKEYAGAEAATRYLSWRQFENSNKTLIVLIGGVTGSGKSTLAAELAYRLDIAGIQSTDMMREIIRSYLPSEVVPTLMHSSFAAWRGLPFPRELERKEVDSPVITGFLSQINAMQPALEASISRASIESQHLILEGVHVLPTHLSMRDVGSDVIVIPIMLAAMDRSRLRKRFKARARISEERKAEKYLNHMDDIWELQSYLLNEADRVGIPIISSQGIEETISEVLGIISDAIVKMFPVENGKKKSKKID